MREIKFRAWSRKFNDYVKPAHFMIDGCGQVFRSEWLDSDTKPKDLIIEQFTGLKDKNGKEIYEGDIIKYKNFSGEILYLTVKWSQEDACFYTGGVRIDYVIRKGEVAGDIHNNPDLLEVSE